MDDKKTIEQLLQEKREFLGNFLEGVFETVKSTVVGETVKAGIIGATGYAGVELIRLLLSHPRIELSALSSVSFEGKKLSEIYPSFYQICDMVLTDEDTVIKKSDVVFTSLPSGISEKIASKCLAVGVKLIDLGADFRLGEKDYEEWYHQKFLSKELHEKAVYCIPELHRERILQGQNVMIVGNPGCYPTSIGLALAPLAKAGLIKKGSVVIDSKSGTTGAGRGLSQTTHFPDCNEAFSPYKVAAHRHIPEIEQTLSELAGEEMKVTFVPHLLPINRGILSTIYVDLKEERTCESLISLYREFYEKERFVRVLPTGQTANLKNVRASNYCDISLHYDKRVNRLILVSAIDNMVKGAAGQAIQNMNLLCGFEEQTGLTAPPPAI